MAAQAFNKSMDEVFEHDARIKPRFDGDSFSGALSTITVVIEGVCLEGAEGWYEKQILMAEVPRVSERLLGGPSMAPIVENDRAVSDSFFLGLWLLSWRHGALSYEMYCHGGGAFYFPLLSWD